MSLLVCTSVCYTYNVKTLGTKCYLLDDGEAVIFLKELTWLGYWIVQYYMLLLTGEATDITIYSSSKYKEDTFL